MDYRLKEALQKSRIYLLRTLMFDDVVDYIIEQDIFSESMLETIRAGNDRLDHVRKLLDNLAKRPDTCFKKFLKALESSKHEHCARFIESKLSESEPPPASTTSNSPSFSLPIQQSLPQHHNNPMEGGCREHSAFSVPSVYSNGEGIANVRYGLPEIRDEFCSIPVQESASVRDVVNPSDPVFAANQSSGDQSEVGASPVLYPRNQRGNLNMYERHFESNPNAVYQMSSLPRGLVLMINNELFTDMSPRQGSQRDQENLHSLFKTLGFNVSHEDNKTAAQMLALLKSFARYEALSSVDAMAVVILSHGGNGIIYGKDGVHRNGQPQAYITDEEIRDVFSARNCPLMAQKPKLIIIQACRGKNEDMPDGVMTRPAALSNAASSMGQDSGQSLGSNVSSSSSSRVANMADMCVIYSTVPGYVSYRHPQRGSPFIQEFAEVVQRNASHEHLMDLMAEVSHQLANRPLPEDLRTVPCTTNTLTKKWFLNPPARP